MTTTDKGLQAYRDDIPRVGTRQYKGLAYFWSHEYKHTLRSATNAQRRRIHNAFLDFGLDLDGHSDLHQELIDTELGNYTIEGE